MRLVLLAVVVWFSVGSDALNPRMRKFEVFGKPKKADAKIGPSNDAYLGTSFMMAFLNSHQDINDNSYTENLTLIMNNPDPTRVAQVTISSVYPQFSGAIVQVQPMSAVRWAVTPAQIQAQYGDPVTGQFTVEQKGISLTSSLPISVVAGNERSDGLSGDMFYVIPTCQLGTDYMTVSDESPLATSRMVTVVITQDGTDVLFQNGSRDWAVYSNQQAGTVISYSSNGYYLSGTYVHTTRPAAVVTGTVCGFGFIVSGSCDHQAIMQIPISSFGNNFALIPLGGAQFSEYTVIPAYDNTNIVVNDTLLGTLNAQNWARLTWDNGFLQASNAIQLVQVGAKVNGYGNPFFVDAPALPRHLVVTGLAQFATGFDSFNQAQVTHYVRVVVPNANIGMVSIDSYAPDEFLWLPIGTGTSGYSWYEQQITPGVHTISGQGVQFSAISYGYGNNTGYGFVVGMELPCISKADKMDKKIAEIMTAAVNEMRGQ